MSSTISFILEQWAAWVREGNGSGYTSPAYALMRDNSGGTVSAARICDEDALRVDAAVCVLRRRNKAQAHAIELWYLGRCKSHSDLAERLQCGRGPAADLLRGGESFIEGYYECAAAA